MEIIYSDEAQQNIEYWKKSGNKIIQKKIQQLLNAIEKIRLKESVSRKF